MKRALLGGLALLSVLAASRDAAAQEVSVAPAGPAAVVRVHLRSHRDRTIARVYSHRPDDSWIMVCATPCTVDVPVGADFRITMGSYEDEPHSFIVPGDLGPEMDLEVKPASVGPLVGGIVMMGTGGAFVVTGLVLLALSDLARGPGATELTTVAYVITGVGVVSAAGGLVWLLNRSHEPRVTDKPRRAPGPVYGRADTLLGDVASAQPRGSPVPAAFSPLRFSFTF